MLSRCFCLLILSDCSSIHRLFTKTYTVEQIVNLNQMCMIFGNSQMSRILTSNFELSDPIHIENYNLDTVNDVIKYKNKLFVVYNGGLATLQVKNHHLILHNLDNGIINPNSIICNHNRCVVVNYFGNMAINSYQGDYQHWQHLTDHNISLGVNKVIYYKNKYFVVTDNGDLYYSHIAQILWTKIPLNIGKIALNNIKVIDDSLYIVGNKGLLLSSSDGFHWQQYNKKMFNGYDLTDIAFGNNKFVITGNSGKIFISDNSKQFSAVNHKVTVNNLIQVEFFNNHFIVAGYGGVILISDNYQKWRLLFLGEDYKVQLLCS